MNLVRCIQWLRDHLRGVVRVCLAGLALLVVLDTLPWLVDKTHAHTPIEHVPGFWSVFGLVGCAVLILASKAFGHAGIMRREDYYDE